MLEKIAQDSYSSGVVDVLNSLDIDQNVKVATYNLLEKNANRTAILEQLARAGSAAKGAGRTVGSRVMEAGRNLGRGANRSASRRLGDLAILGAGGVGATALGAELLADDAPEASGLSNAELAALGLGGAALTGGGLYAANEAGLI